MNVYTVHRPVANRTLVRDRDRRRLRELAIVALLLAPVALALSVFTWVELEVIDTGYRLDALERRRAELERRESQLRLEAAHLANPRRIERLATRDLGMAPPALDRLLFYREESP